VVEQPQGVVLHHDVVAVQGLLGLVGPPLDHVAGGAGQSQGADQGGARDRRVLVHDALLHVALHGLQHGVVGDAAQGPDSGGPVEILLAGHVLRQRAGHNDHVLGNGAQLLNAQVDHAAEHHVLGLEELRHREEAIGGLAGHELLALVDQVQDLRQDVDALPRVHRRLVEGARLLEHRRLLQILVRIARSCWRIAALFFVRGNRKIVHVFGQFRGKLDFSFLSVLGVSGCV